jgi:O-antigen/teichoic acid export membrane protein
LSPKPKGAEQLSQHGPGSSAVLPEAEDLGIGQSRRRLGSASGWRLGPWLTKSAYSIVDQALAVGGMLAANITLARTQTKEEFGMFALSYSVLTLLLGLHNAAILEPFTVYGSGRYRNRFAEYFQLISWGNAALGLMLTALVLGSCLALHWIAPHLLPRALVGLGVTISVLLCGALLRRVFYLQRKANLAAAASLIFFLTVGCGLWLTNRAHRLDSLSIFLILAAGWFVAGLSLAGKLPFGKTRPTFLEYEPDYWREHWKYARWVLLTALVFQLTTQGYYWLVAALLSVRDVAELKAVTLVVAPADQIFIALNYLVLPLLSAHYAARKIGQLLSAWKWYAIAITAVTMASFLFIRIFGKALTHLLYGGRYDDVASLLTLLALLPVVMGVGHTMNAALKAAESPRLVFCAYLASGAVTLVAGVPLVARFGLRGAVYGMLLSGASYTAALTVGFVMTFRRQLRQPVAAAPPLETGAHA